MIKYKYAKDENEKLIDIDILNEKNRHKSKFFCISCKKELIPRLGRVNIHHFAHKKAVTCSGETYLHLLGKQLFFDTYKECLIKKQPFTLETSKKRTCNHYKKELGLSCTLPNEKQQFDLTQYFDKISIEKREGSFIPDILLSRKGNKEKIFVEIAVTHQITEQKYNSNYRIIEIYIEEEEDVEIIRKKHLSEFLHMVSFVNFKTEKISSFCKGKCKASYDMLTLDEHGMCNLFMSRNLEEIRNLLNDKSNKLVDYEITKNRGSSYYKLIKRAVKTYAQKKLHVRSCFLCQHQSENIFYDENLDIMSLPIICNHFDTQCEPNRAVTCKHFKLYEKYL